VWRAQTIELSGGNKSLSALTASEAPVRNPPIGAEPSPMNLGVTLIQPAPY
jgi:hypothetical protein